MSEPDISNPLSVPPPSSASHVRRKLLPVSWGIWFWGHIRRIVVFVIGITVIGFGIAMLVLPGPGWVTIFAGLALLATEFAWAKWTLKHAKERLTQLIEVATGSQPAAESPQPPSDVPTRTGEPQESLPSATDSVKLGKVDVDIHNSP